MGQKKKKKNGVGPTTLPGAIGYAVKDPWVGMVDTCRLPEKIQNRHFERVRPIACMVLKLTA